MTPCTLAAVLMLPLVAAAQGDLPPLTDALKFPAQSIAPGKSADLALPALPARAGAVVVLRFGAVITSPQEAGCNLNAQVLLNGAPLTARTAGGEERLLGRDNGLVLAAQTNTGFPALDGDRLMVMYAPTVERGNRMTTDGQGATFALDISDLARPGAANTLTFRNVLAYPMPPGFGALRVEGIEVGRLERARLPQAPSRVPQRGEIKAEVAAGALALAQSTRGGFAVRLTGAPDAGAHGPELRVETAVGMSPEAPPSLIADDSAPEAPGVRVEVAPWGPAGFAVTATWPGLRLRRTLALRGELVEWKERWTNTADAVRSLPFRHRAFLRRGPARFRLGGSPDNVLLAGSAPNPTLFVESADRSGQGFGLAAESDWLRLLMALRRQGGVGELFSECLALAPGASVDFDLTLTPVPEGGYWRFLNGLRRRWGVAGITQERPVFWGYAQAAGNLTGPERMARSLGHLGPIYVVLGPWQRLEPDANAVKQGRTPKLPPGAPRAPGACPDFDVDAFLTYRHREADWAALKAHAELIRAACPQVKVMNMLHPAMEAVYKPLQDRWPIAAEAIMGPDGKTFEDSGYSQSWLADMTAKDWAVLYYVPRPGSTYLAQIISGVRRGLEECRLDGLYCDEFSWAYNGRGYSRYDYSRWDGYSADLDARGGVVRLKCDNAFVTEACQLQMIHEVLGRGRFFLNNGGNSLRSVCSLPHARFVEGGNGASSLPQGHLSPTPLVLGNMGDESTLQGVFSSVRACLREGCVYSPTAVNLLLEDADNFVCKQYPLTVEELGPGWIVGRERVITEVSRAFRWPPQGGALRLYVYDARGKLARPLPRMKVAPGGEVPLTVPEGGLVIAERM